jgi:membrane-associated protease RseP (regulator of RpoE activity)
MNIDITLALIFYLLLILYIAKNKSKFEFQGKIMALYKTKLGLKLMDKIAKISPGFLHLLGYLSIVVGFLGMGFIFYWLLKGTFDLLFVAQAAPAVAPVLPGIKVIPGLPVLSFLHWIMAILIIAVIHEFSHGIYARLNNIKIKSSGFALFGPILAAFVEPDEKQMAKKSKKAQLAVFSAGPFSNILTGFLFILIMSFVTAPLYDATHDSDGIQVNQLIANYPMETTGVELPFVIKEINGKETLNFQQFLDITNEIGSNQQMTIQTNKGEYTITTGENPDNKSKGFIGVSNFEIVKISNKEIVEKYGTFTPPLISWIHMLFFWLWVISWGVGLFNLLPLGPVDGGRMLLTSIHGITKNEKIAKKIWSIVSLSSLILIFINLAPFLWKLLLFLIKPLLILITLI